jgi:hypothetical protein
LRRCAKAETGFNAARGKVECRSSVAGLFFTSGHLASAKATKASSLEALAFAADRRARMMKQVAIPPNTTTIMPSKLRIPQFMPAAIGESDAP